MSRSTLPLVTALVIAVAIAACTAAPGASSAPSGAPSPACSPGAPSSACAPSAPGSAAAGRTTTDWGTIWDALPPSFPAYPGAQPTTTGAGPATAILQVRATTEVAADWYREALEVAGFRIEGVNGPLEDGSIVIDATGDGACRVQAAIAPLGGVTVATIFVGADCPFR
jgi:hypothetical protein